MRSPSTPDPFAGSNPPSHTLGAGGNVPADFFGGGHGVTSEIEEYWKSLEKFFEENELALAKAERSTMDPDRASDFGTTIDIMTDTVNVVLSGLSALAQVHPALSVAIFAFHTVVSLELTRRDNDKKVMAVMLQMQSMMCAMFQLRKLRYSHVPEENRDMENSRLQRLIARIAKEIKACGSDLNYYTGRSTLSRVISSKVYEKRFAAHVETFAQRRSELQNAVTAYTAVGVDTVNIGIAAIGEKMTFMNDKLDSIVAMFQTLNSARERELLNFLQEKGGSDKCINDDRLLTRLLAKAGESKKTSTAGSGGREEQQQLISVRRELKNDLENLDTLLTQNLPRFQKLIEIQTNNLSIHMEGTNTKLDQITMLIIDQGRLIHKAIGPTVALTDPVLKYIWEKMSLKSSVKAKHFISNFRDHIYMERMPLASPLGSPPAVSRIDLPPTEDENDETPSEILSNAGSSSNQIFMDELKDEWALKYLTVSYIHPIIEAMDEDCSGWISINEANKFARARPAGRSLISWMAYWAVGWHHNLTQYKEEIYSTILQMHFLSGTALPHNQQLIKSYLNGPDLERVEALLRSIESLDADMEIDTDASLKEYATSIADAQEEKLRRNLSEVSYVLRSVNDVKLVVNHGNQRVETWILPILALVLRRHSDIVVLANTKLLHPNEMSVHEESIGFILDVFEERLNGLKAIFHQVYRGNVDAHFKVFAYGMFYVFFKDEEFFRSDSVLYQEEWSNNYKTTYRAQEALAKDPPDTSILAEGPGKTFEFQYEDHSMMQGPSMPEPWPGSKPSSQTLGAGAPVCSFGNGHGATNETTELHWKALDKFVAENELAIAKAEKSTMDPDKASDFGTTIDIMTDTVNVVLNGLTELAQVHPALGVAIFAFHAIISLDLTGCDNDKKVMAVKLQMQFMMCAMFQLRKLRYTHVPEENRDLENSRLQRLIARIAEEIKACGSDLNYYTGRSTLSRFISSKVYERRFAAHIETFAQRCSELQSFVTAYTELYHLRDILDGEAELSSDAVVSQGGTELARRRWRFAIECIKSQTTARMNSKKLTIGRMKASRELIKLHYESMAQGTFGEFQTSSYFQIISRFNSPPLLRLYRTLATYRFERMLHDCGIRGFSCDNCSEPITHVRYQCITCTTEKFDDQIDLCHQCRDMDGVNSINREANFVHRKSHSLLRSTPRSWIKMHELAWLIPQARLASEKVKARFRELTASDGASSKTSDPSGGRGNKSIQAPKCAICKTPILALPAWIRMVYKDDDNELICTGCAQNNRSADCGDVLLRVSDSARVWPSEAKSTRVEEDIKDIGLSINAVGDELRDLKDRVKELSDLKDRMKTLESQVNNQMAEMLSMMKGFVLNRTT